MTVQHLAHPHELAHTHGPGCGHEGTVHLDHVDYAHDGVWEREHEGHYDACTACACGNCAGQCVTCQDAACTCATCLHTTCQCAGCSDTCASCVCADCTCTTCKHAA